MIVFWFLGLTLLLGAWVAGQGFRPQAVRAWSRMGRTPLPVCRPAVRTGVEPFDGRRRQLEEFLPAPRVRTRASPRPLTPGRPGPGTGGDRGS